MLVALMLVGAAALAPGWVPAQSGQGQPMPHAPAPTDPEPMHPATPFYREWTFHVLLGTLTAGAAFVVYRVARSRRRARRVPTGFLDEAVLAVDLVDSTHWATHYGSAMAMRARHILADRTRSAAERREVRFTETTGDGCLMTFPTVTRAVETAVALFTELKRQPPDLSPGPSLEVRAGISYGEILLDEDGLRHGAAINKAFRLLTVTGESFTQVAGAREPVDVPDRSRILLDEEAANELPSGDPVLRFVGFASLKGFAGLHRIYEGRWEARNSATDRKSARSPDGIQPPSMPTGR